jgi:hypothetical protein
VATTKVQESDTAPEDAKSKQRPIRQAHHGDCPEVEHIGERENRTCSHRHHFGAPTGNQHAVAKAEVSPKGSQRICRDYGHKNNANRKINREEFESPLCASSFEKVGPQNKKEN